MKFEYKLDGIGWADVNIEINSQEFAFTPSYCLDSLGDLVNGLVEIIQGLVSDDDLKKESTFEWSAEPAICRWRLRTNGEELTIQINLYEDDVTERYETKINTTCPLKEFLNVLIQAMDKLLKTHGFIGYRDTWHQHDFPISGYLKLKSYLIAAVIPTTKNTNQIGIEMSYSDLGEEIKILPD